MRTPLLAFNSPYWPLLAVIKLRNFPFRSRSRQYPKRNRSTNLLTCIPLNYSRNEDLFRTL